MIKWEAGIDRIIDFRLLPESKPVVIEKSITGPMSPSAQSAKHYELVDEWETFKFRFSVFYPPQNGDEMTLSSGREDVPPIAMA